MQMFASPGVRKDDRDNQELGEDATGFIAENDHAVLWIADAAPGMSVNLGNLNFNSRVLAKYVGSCFEATAFKYKTQRPILDEVFCKEFKHELCSELYRYLEIVCDSLKQIEDSLPYELLVTKLIGGKKYYFFEWSTTFVGVIIDIKNKGCSTMLIGDCIALIDNKIITAQLNRLFVEWYVNEDFNSIDLKIVMNSPLFYSTKNMKSIILMSDGVTNYSEIEKDIKDKDIETMWNDLKSKNTRTDDDKTAIFFELPR